MMRGKIMFNPKRVIFEKGTLDTDIGKNIYNKIKIQILKL